MSRPAVFLDRDGTINVEKEYLHRIEDWEWVPGAIEAIRRINDMGYLVIVVTNQAGVARGYYDEAQLHALHAAVDGLLDVTGAHIDAYYYCPHHPEFGEIRDCQCRKPAPGMLLAAQRDFGIDLSRSFMVGDKAIDVEAGQRAGVSPVLVMTGYGKEEQRKLPDGIGRAPDVLGAVELIGATIGKMTP
jgi:D-glycero-D-manno-heptose 1,7-bisphosphate phosphatase